MIYKPCSLCDQRVEKARYRYNKDDTWKRCSWCQICQREKDRDKYYEQQAKNPERFRERALQRNLDPVFRAYKNKWARENYKKEKYNATEHSYYGNNRIRR